MSVIGTWLITGGNKGFGLSLTKSLANKGERVFVGIRNYQDKAQFIDYKNVTPLSLDVTDRNSLLWAKKEIEAHGLNYIVNTEVVGHGDNIHTKIHNMNKTDFMRNIEINTWGPINVCSVFKSLLTPITTNNGKTSQPKIININSLAASFTYGIVDLGRSYPISQTALNMVTKLTAHDIPEACVVAIRPGDLDGIGIPYKISDVFRIESQINTPIRHEQLTEEIITMILNISPDITGSFITSNGKIIPW